MECYGIGMGEAHPPEEAEFEYELLDRRGRRAIWLEKYITPKVQERLGEEIHIMQEGELYAP
jgi:hypothetical protein